MVGYQNRVISADILYGQTTGAHYYTIVMKIDKDLNLIWHTATNRYVGPS